jgi:hypothetical protein
MILESAGAIFSENELIKDKGYIITIIVYDIF